MTRASNSCTTHVPIALECTEVHISEPQGRVKVLWELDPSQRKQLQLYLGKRFGRHAPRRTNTTVPCFKFLLVNGKPVYAEPFAWRRVSTVGAMCTVTNMANNVEEDSEFFCRVDKIFTVLIKKELKTLLWVTWLKWSEGGRLGEWSTLTSVNEESTYHGNNILDPYDIVHVVLLARSGPDSQCSVVIYSQ
jgi:hypothetical protein